MAEDQKNNTFSEDNRLKILGYRWDFWKFFLGTFILGCATAVTTYIFKDFELKTANRKAESDYLQPYLIQYLTLLEKDSALKFDKAFNMAEFVSYIVTDRDLKDGWCSLRDTLKYRRDRYNDQSLKKQKERDSLNQIRNSLGVLIYNNSKDSIKVEKLNGELKKLNFAINENKNQQKFIEKNLANPPSSTNVIDSSAFFLGLSTIKIYSKEYSRVKAAEIDKLFSSHNVQSQNTGSTPKGYSIDNVKDNQIVYYNSDQIKFCLAVQKLLQENNYGFFSIRPSSGFGVYKSDYCKIYLVK